MAAKTTTRRTAKKTPSKRTAKSTAKTTRASTSKRSGRPAPSFLRATHKAVREVMARTLTLPDFRKTETKLDKKDKLLIVDQALLMMRDNYVHLPLKENMHAVRPVQALQRLKQRVETGKQDLADLDFHREMLRIFTSVRDLHTNYILPAPYNSMTAYVPFLMEDFIENGERRYLFTHTVAGFKQPPFEPGVEITMWNGAPIDLAVRANSDRFAGSNEEARRARGIEFMTIRPLITSLPPDEDFVLVGYRTKDGKDHEIRLDWLVFSPDEQAHVLEISKVFDPKNFAMGLDIEMYVAGLAKKYLFAPTVVAAETAMLEGRKPRRAAGDQNLTSVMPGVITARPVETPSGTFGYIRIRTFSVDDVDAFLEEFVRLAGELPQDGLIIDVRDNGGGVVLAGEELLQLLTPRMIEPEPVQFINTALNLDLVRKHAPSHFQDFTLEPWKASMEEAVSTGAVFSRGAPITDPVRANAIGQRYQGPVVLITDGKCYSTTDIFAAGFQDHEIGPIIGVDGNTGAGGANVWTLDLLGMLAGSKGPYKGLPNGANMRVSMRRTLRVGERAGTPVEDLGVQPDLRHDMTENDLLNNNADLIAYAGSVLKKMPVYRLRGSLREESEGVQVVDIDTFGLDRVDVYVDDRPIGSLDVTNGETELRLEDVPVFLSINLYGFKKGDLAAAWRITE